MLIHAKRWWLAVGLVTSLIPRLFAEPPLPGATQVVYTAYGNTHPQPVLEQAYARLRRLYVLDVDSRQCVPASTIGAELVEGKVELATNARILLHTTVGNRVAVLGYRGTFPMKGEDVACMVIRSGAETYSMRNKDREVIAVPQYRDVTMTFAEMVAFIRNGQHFPEAPELNTQPGRKGLFSTDRTPGSKVEQHLKQGKGTVAPPSLPPP